MKGDLAVKVHETRTRYNVLTKVETGVRQEKEGDSVTLRGKDLETSSITFYLSVRFTIPTPFYCSVLVNNNIDVPEGGSILVIDLTFVKGVNRLTSS